MTFYVTPVKFYIELFQLSQHHHEEINRRLHYCLRLLYHQVLFCKVVENHGLNCLDKNNNIFQTTRFNHTMIFFKLTD